MKKILLITSIVYFMLNSTVFAKISIKVIKKSKNKTHKVYIISNTKGKYPYPIKEDPINQMLGRRAGVIYAYKEIETIINKKMKDIIKSYTFFSKENFIANIFITNLIFGKNEALITAELEFNITHNEFKKLKKTSSKKIELIKKHDKIENFIPVLISNKTWKKIIKTPDSRYAKPKELEKIKKL